ncbi:FK506-binding protein 5 isoform X9 [Ischnura elegans]|uniref:FK506-binding protein 5 isoform X9 n=1 Tax=Ischnura elegans TaxID=197161 RepID=UPI001ED883D6|nr:FK506-binding protein 5 isoform X9 [Ischnura elegans]
MQEQEREEIVREQILQEQISQQQIVQEQTSQEQTVQEVEQEEEQSREPTVSQEILGSPASPPSDLLLDFAEPPSPLGAIDPFCGVAAEFPEDVMTPEDEPSPEEAVVPSGRAPWASAEVEVEDVVAEVVEGVLGGDRRVPFIGPADLSLVDFSTTVTDDSAFEMLTPPTEEKAFGVVNIPEIRVDTPPPSTPEDDTSVAECSQGKDSQEDAVQSPQDVGSPLEEAPPSPLDLGSPQEEVPSSPLEMGSPLEEVAPSPLGVGSPLEEVAPSPLGLGSPLEELAPSPLGLGSPLEEVPTSPLVLGSPMEEMAPSPLGLGRPLEEVPASPLSGDAVSSPDDDGWECVGGVRVEGVPDEDEEASPESTSEGARAMNMFEGTVVEEDDDVEGLVGEQVEFVGEEREPERVVEEEVQEEEVVHPVEVLEVEGCADSAVAGAVGSGMAGGEGSPTEESPPRAAETLTSEQSQSPAPETSTPEPAEEIAMPIGKVVIPSSFTAAEDAADGTIRQRHVDVVSSECGVPASRPSLVDWNAVVKKEEQKVEIESAQDGEAPKKAGTRKVKKDSGDGKKKTKKGKKSDAEKENFSVNSQSNMGSQLGSGFPKGENEAKEMMDEEGLSGISLQELRETYCSQASKPFQVEDKEKDIVAASVPIRDLRSSFNKFDELSKKTVIHVKSVDSSKVQKQFNEAAAASSTVGPSLCRSCCKQVFQMEQIKAERAVWHKNCFRCKECSKQLTVDIYSSHEGQLYCKPHFKELFKPKVVVETENVGPVRPRKPEMIIRENQPVELPPDVVRASDKPDLGLEELSSLNVKSRFRVFEKDPSEDSNASLEKSSSAVNVKRSPSILSKLARFQKKGMDIGVTDDSLNGVPFEQSDSSSEAASSSEEEGDEEGGVVKSSRHKKKERPVSFGKMDDMKTKWESVGANGVRKTREELREERKEEIQRLRSRLFQGKLGKTKEMYEQAVMESEKGTSVTSNGVKRQPSERARSLKERFEKGETGVDLVEDVTEDLKKEREEQVKKAREEELSVFEAGISKKSRTLFLELDKAQKQQPPSMPTPTKSPLPKEEVRKAREIQVTRQVSDDIVRASDRVEDVQVETADICNKFKFFETYQDAPRKKKPFRITPPREGQVKTGSPEKEIYRDPNVVRCEDHTEDDSEVIVKSHTTTKMLSLFRQMEENATKDEVPEGPKPLKRFTPPPDYTRDSESEEEEEDEEDEDEEEEEEEEEGQQQQEDPNIVRASDKVEDEFLKQALSQNAARAKSLKAKFERWEAEMERKGEGANGVIGDDETPSVDTTRNLRARFESLQSEAKNTATLERQSRPRVNRFVEIQASCAEVCSKCGKRVYPLEKVEANGKVLHKACFRCLQCKCFLRMETYTMNNGNLYCLTHFKQLFISKGNYDDAFGSNQHKRKWSTSLKESKQEEENENVDEKNVKGKGVEQKDNFFDEDSFCAEDLQ